MTLKDISKKLYKKYRLTIKDISKKIYKKYRWVTNQNKGYRIVVYFYKHFIYKYYILKCEHIEDKTTWQGYNIGLFWFRIFIEREVEN